MERPDKSNYLILESFGETKEKNCRKTVYQIILNNNSIFKIGRNKKNDIIIDDNSIENEFAEIIFDEKNKKAILKSIKNNAPTDVLVRKNLIIKEKPINLQTGLTQFQAKLIKNN